MIPSASSSKVCTVGAVILTLATPARGAEVTRVPPALGLVAGLHYGGSREQGGLEESGQRIANRYVSRHDLLLSAEFAPITGIAVNLGLGITPSLRYRFPDARVMIIEPEDGGGSYLSGPPITSEATLDAAGLTGIWLGAAVSPFREGEGRNERSTWRLDAAVRSPSPKRNLWTAPEGRRGAAPGGAALRLAGAFSADRGVASPYLTAAWQGEGRASVTVIDEAGTTWAEDLSLRPASTVDLVGGVELEAVSVPSTGAHLAFDLWIGAQYRTWEDVATGVYLPNVVDSARSIPVTSGDVLALRGGIALDYTINAFLRARTGVDLRYGIPNAPEHVYAVRTTPDTWQIGWFLQFEGMADFAR